jgi:hypothetical protein
VAREVIIKCDKCGGTDEAEEFQLDRNGETRTVAACAEHKVPLVELYELGEAPSKTPAKRGPGRPPTHSVVPIEDWKPGE